LTQRPADAKRFIRASVILRELHEEAPEGHFTLAWLMSSLHKQSFGVLMLLLAIAAAAPGISFVAGLLLMIPAFQMAAGRGAPFFPRWIAARPLPTRHLGVVVKYAITVLRFFEKAVHPRWTIPPEATKRVVGITVIILSARLILTPIPLSNVVPAFLIALISLAYLEEDGLLLSIALLAGLAVIAVDLGVIWEAIRGAT